jgi:hypothetical protein
MTSRPVTWSEIHELFQGLAHIYRDEGRTNLPARLAVPRPQVEAECDQWCREMHRTLSESPLPPLHLREWLMVRALLVSSLAQALADKSSPSPGPLDAALIEQLMIHEWHGALLARWNSSGFQNPYGW